MKIHSPTIHATHLTHIDIGRHPMSTVSQTPSGVAVDQSETETVEQVRWARVNRLSRGPAGSNSVSDV